MKETEENLNSDFDLKVKHDLTERLKTEPPAELAPSPILSAISEKKKFPAIIIVIAIALVSLALNVFLIVTYFQINLNNEVLQNKLKQSEADVYDLRVQLNEVENGTNK